MSRSVRVIFKGEDEQRICNVLEEYYGYMGKFGDSVLGFKEYFDEVLRYSNKTVECWAEDCKYGMETELRLIAKAGVIFEGSVGYDDFDGPVDFFSDGIGVLSVAASDSGWVVNYDPDTGLIDQERLEYLDEMREVRKRVHLLLYGVDKEV